MFKNFVTTAYVGIVKDSDRCDVYLSVFKGKKFVKSEHHTLRMEDGLISRVGLSFLKGLYEKYYFVYSSTLVLADAQGAFYGTGKDKLELFEIRSSGNKILEIDKKWSLYALESEIGHIKTDFEMLGGIDFLFSPYSVIDRLKESGCVMYVLRLHGFAIIAIFDEKTLAYGNFYTFERDLIFDVDHELTIDKNQIEDEQNDDMESEFTSQDAELTDQDTAHIGSLEKDTKLIEFLKTCLNSYYKDSKYEAAFIDRVLVFDPYSESEEFKALAEDELLLSVDFKYFDLAQVICEMTQQELEQK